MRKSGSLRAIFISFALTVLLVNVGQSDIRASAQSSSQYFPETGHTVTATFLDYWTAHGGLAQFGYHISDELQERSDADGKTYTMQYFERAVFELHPENAGTPYEVLLTLLGSQQYLELYGPDGAPDQAISTDNPRFFPETGHTIGGPFRTYWETHRGL